MAEFKASLSGAARRRISAAPLAALWWAAKGNWDQGARHRPGTSRSADGSWVHAYLHRVEGDLGNAGYWYRRPANAAPTDAIETEWERMVLALGSEEEHECGKRQADQGRHQQHGRR